MPTTATLGQPLQLSVPLRLEPNEDLPPECLSAQVSFADNLQQPGTTTLRLQPAAPGALERTMLLATTTRVDEPIVSVEISVGCAAKVVRRFTLLADPPLFNPPSPAVAAAPAVAGEGAGVVPGAPRDENPQGALAAAPTAEPASAPIAPTRPAVRRRPAQPSTGVAAAPRPPRPAARAPAGETARLRLAPLEAGARVGAAAPSSAAPAASVPAGAAPSNAAAEAAAASIAAAEQAASAAAAAAASAQARVDELEATMKKLRAQDAATQQTIASLQARVQRAEGEQLGNPLLYALAALAALLLGAVIWLWRQRSAEREAQGWLLQAAATPADGPATEQAPATSAETAAFAPVPTLKAWVSKPNEEGFDDTLALTRAGTMSTMPALLNSGHAPLDAAVKPLVPEAQKREVSVEELIDLEQQAEFFIVLGQDDAAIDLLMTHLRSTAGTSPLPYLKLLEIYKRRGERSDYEKLRERFNSRFNAYAPSWETDLQGGRTLDEYPSVMGRLESLWVTPQRAREVLQATLVRAEDSGPDPVGDDSFDLPAYRELMLLYSIARDVSDQHADEPPVDVMLPIGDDVAPAPAVFERLLATSSMPAQPDVHKPLEIDFTLDDPPARPEPPRS
ncbi:MAG TPA: hypothetical protein VFR90_13685 [Methylibium sp.]|uniref:hypothetical protein n=1 Tax=Methylibium sp. TaxID=2067992 RepID=UPI002DB81F6B|nr:hypothetical protein [Methylibium sp.]HEU4460168.1 hypothetical protein [Methylibium sp.]